MVLEQRLRTWRKNNKEKEMKKYNIFNYIRHKEDIKESMPIDKNFQDYNRNELIIKFMPLVEAMARKFSTSQ